MTVDTFRAMAIQAIARKVVPEDLADLLGGIMQIDDRYSLIRTEVLKRIYERRLRRQSPGGYRAREMERLVRFLAEYESDEVRLISIRLNDGRSFLALVDALMNKLIFWSGMWVLEPDVDAQG
ncbi:hypothetical protein [Spongiactinospora sp. TRM90649]|uniref:hypothetical protein n=1 Tax=Spongiactinospora sp. TRM90649 TaxID=3031114 RepID=UPI0023F660B4|nr:hypothetical protein [Spongiactinospora sp. TRM90649]MDF5755099.1 hypothetical protein [Spongiactinospora sp. TRM90649]